MTHHGGSILIVDDEEIIRGMLEIELEDRYEVVTCSSPSQALAILTQKQFDLVIADINMPEMKGYELLSKVRALHPKTNTALITAYNTDDYIRMSRQYNICNIISKSTPFNFDEFNSIVNSLITGDILGLEKYMLKSHEVMYEGSIMSSSQIAPEEEKILNAIGTFCQPEPFVHLLLEELITNAVYHAPVDESGKEKYLKHSPVELEEHERVVLKMARDDEKYGVSVLDNSGKLSKDQILYRIDRHINGEGLMDTNGRGLHMSRLYSDRLIVNVQQNVATEVLFFNYLSSKYKGYKPLYIFEV